MYSGKGIVYTIIYYSKISWRISFSGYNIAQFQREGEYRTIYTYTSGDHHWESTRLARDEKPVPLHILGSALKGWADCDINSLLKKVVISTCGSTASGIILELRWLECVRLWSQKKKKRLNEVQLRSTLKVMLLSQSPTLHPLRMSHISKSKISHSMPYSKPPEFGWGDSYIFKQQIPLVKG